MNITKLCLLSLCAAVLPLTLSAQQHDQETPAASAESLPAPTGQQETDSSGAGAEITSEATQNEETMTFGSLDVNDDGRLSQSEAEKSARLSEQFGALDVDEDSHLSMAEYGKLSSNLPL